MAEAKVSTGPVTPEMKIIDWKTHMTDTYIFVFGWGDDGKIYQWSRMHGKWELFQYTPAEQLAIEANTKQQQEAAKAAASKRIIEEP